MPLIKDPAEIITVTFDFAAYDVTINNPVVSCDVVSGKVDASAAAMLSVNAVLRTAFRNHSK